MAWIRYCIAVVLSLLCSLGALVVLPAAHSAECDIATAFRQMKKDTPWQARAVHPVSFDTHHPQGFARVRDHLFVSSVEVLERTRRYETPQHGLDRSAGRGKGHLFKMDMQGNLVAQVELGEGDSYHPGGIDYDGRYIWVPVAEYRPNATTIIYRVDPVSMEVEVVYRVADHLGSLVHNTDDGTLHGVSWGARRFYTWPLEDGRRVVPADTSSPRFTLNPAHYIDYQDCQYVGAGRALCSGLSTYRQHTGRPPFALGGMELVDLREGRPLHQVPVSLWTEDGVPLTQNPVEVEATQTGLRVYFMPEDNESRLFIYDVPVCS